eukprot:GHVU01144029.1.p1 GENE.GHVU01144029.1~~GHVU01144029.1.p1  ORF type:complete len:402 (-),score=35.66 GHVU01144029.1:429-1634(-)
MLHHRPRCSHPLTRLATQAACCLLPIVLLLLLLLLPSCRASLGPPLEAGSPPAVRTSRALPLLYLPYISYSTSGIPLASRSWAQKARGGGGAAPGDTRGVSPGGTGSGGRGTSPISIIRGATRDRRRDDGYVFRDRRLAQRCGSLANHHPRQRPCLLYRLRHRHTPVLASGSDGGLSRVSGGATTLNIEGSPNVLIAGPPCVGKGTVGKLVAKRWGLKHISMGDILRDQVKQQSDIGRQIEGLIAQGKLVPQDIVFDLLHQRLKSLTEQSRGWLLDGFPRNQAQAEQLDKAGATVKAFVLLEAPDSVLVERVTMRRLDPITNTIYNLKTYPPPTDEIRFRLIQRKDDSEAVIRARIEEYRASAGNLMKHYRDVMVAIDGSERAEVLVDDIARKIRVVEASD